MTRRERQQGKRDTKRAQSISRHMSYQGPWSISLRHVDGLEDHAQARIATLKLQKRQLIDTDLYRFALGPSGRLWGFLEEHVFYPMWWDPEHRVCSYDEDLTETIPADLAVVRRAANIVTRGISEHGRSRTNRPSSTASP